MTYQIELVWIKVFLVDIKMLSTTFIERIISLYNDKHFFLFSKYYKQLIKNIVERKMFIQLVNVTLASPVIKFLDTFFLWRISRKSSTDTYYIFPRNYIKLTDFCKYIYK